MALKTMAPNTDTTRMGNLSEKSKADLTETGDKEEEEVEAVASGETEVEEAAMEVAGTNQAGLK